MTPAVVRAGWDLRTQNREEVFFAAGRILGHLARKGIEPEPAELATFFPLEPVVNVVVDDSNDTDQPFALVVVIQPPTAIPVMTTPGMIVFAFLLAGAGFLIARSRFSG
jgi:hypothetical protein